MQEVYDIYLPIRLPRKFLKIIDQWHALDWWRVNNKGLETGFAIETLDERIRNSTTPHTQKEINEDFIKKIKRWVKDGWIDERPRGIR